MRESSTCLDTMPLDLKKVKCGGAEHTVSTAPHAAGESVDLFAPWILSPAARISARPSRPGVQAVLFDLDGVLVDTARFHYIAWKQLADELGLPFNERLNEGFRGVGRMECLDKLLGRHAREIAAAEKRVLADRKNNYYLERVMTLSPADLAPGVRPLLDTLCTAGVSTAVVSASRNARLVLDLLTITSEFTAIIDGDMVTRGKPDPEGFLLAARRLRVDADQCVVVEDAEAGVKVGQAAGMVCVGVGPTAHGAEVRVNDLAQLTLERIDLAWQQAAN